jgi:hypothetical protein
MAAALFLLELPVVAALLVGSVVTGALLRTVESARTARWRAVRVVRAVRPAPSRRRFAHGVAASGVGREERARG